VWAGLEPAAEIADADSLDQRNRPAIGQQHKSLFELRNAKQRTARELSSTADLIGTNTAAALAFDDSLSGEKLLAALTTRPHVRGALLYNADGRFFASFLRPDLDGYVSKPIHTDLLREEIVRVVQFAGMCARVKEDPSVNPKTSKCLDREEFLNRVEHDEDLAREILAIFQTDSQMNRAALGAAVATGDAGEVRSVAHAFRGMLANLSADPASAAAGRLEDLAKEKKTGEFVQAWQVFEKELSGVLLEVEHLLAGALR
jgi:HPt (histidine-containing phosphotransfer) domain-containing protein